MIQAGMWLLCDAGWARIERMVLSSGEVAARSVRRTTLVRLLATLRPGAEAEVIEIDVIERRLVFEKPEQVFVCGRCNTFISRDLNLVLTQHNRAAHGGTGARYRQVQQRVWNLTRCVFAAQLPGSAFENLAG
jgi:hypothetical protein